MGEPERRCVGCGRRAPKRELLRLAAVAGRLQLDSEGTLPGRGAYVCRNPDCFARARAHRAFQRALRRNVAVSETVDFTAHEH